MDSFIVLIINLEVHQNEFDIQYQSFFLQQMKQNLHVLFNDKIISQLKNLKFNHDVVSAGYSCHVFFLYMLIIHKDLNNQLNDQQQRI